MVGSISEELRIKMIRLGFKVTSSLQKKINKLAKKVGCPLNWCRTPGLQWNTIDVACKTQNASNIIHDIAHWMLSTKEGRAHLDFGLGAGPESESVRFEFQDGLKSIYSPDIRDIKEAQASALGIYWEKKLGLPWEKTMSYHNWDFNDLKQAWKKLKYRIKKSGFNTI
jgi:hypothetical protein